MYVAQIYREHVVYNQTYGIPVIFKFLGGEVNLKKKKISNKIRAVEEGIE